jgi:DNA-directed RNA polymerase specialized sigma24 family protein
MEGSLEDSVTTWMRKLRAGDGVAAKWLWERYSPNMLRLARCKLGRTPCRGADEEDIALSAFKSFCHAAANGHFPGPINRDNLWQLLFALTARKVVGQVRYEGRRKRNGTRCEVELDGLAAPEPGPELAAQLDEEMQRLLDRLGDPQLRSVALGKMDGLTSAEIAAQMGCSERTVERKLRVIRRLWQEGGPCDGTSGNGN